MSIEHPSPGTALDALHAALTHLQALAAMPSADPFYASAAEQVAAIVAGIEGRVTPTQDTSSFGIPLPPNPGAAAEKPR
jgi:hypothetical protein